MPVPKYRTSASKRNMRRSHHALQNPGISLCSNCGTMKRPHIACGSCGFYKGKQVFETKQASTAWDGEGLESKETK